MRYLAVKWGFAYKGRTLPESFHITCYPANCIKTVWNVIEGQRAGISFLIFDSTVGEVKGQYCTFIAIHGQKGPFMAPVMSEQVIEASGWSAVYRKRMIQIPWTISIPRIEDLLEEVLSKSSALHE